MASNQSLSLSYPSFFLSVAASASAGFLLAYKILRMSTKEMAVKVAEEAKENPELLPPIVDSLVYSIH